MCMNYCSQQLFKNLWLADGTGAPLRRCAVLVAEGRIAAIEPEIIGSAAGRVCDLGGRILAPGFLDVHGHSDLSVLASPEAFGKVSQGVTAEIVGNCGLSAFPVTRFNRDHLQALYANYGVELTWSDYAGYRAELVRRGVRLRIFSLCGHNTLRAAVVGYEQHELSGAEHDEMNVLLKRMLDQGALGLSTGLLYVPGKFADSDEIVNLMRTLAGRGACYATHLRSEGNELLESLEETIENARRAGLSRLQVSHFKTAGRANWHKLDAALALLEEARRSGLALHVDRYPYTESMTQLSVILPDDWSDLDDTAIEQALTDPVRAAALEHALKAARAASYWRTVRLVSTGAAAGRGDEGESLEKIAAVHQLPPAALVVKLLRDDSAGTVAAFQGMSEENLHRILALPYCCCGSDENARPADYSIGRSHPRAFGSLPRFLKLRLEDGAAVEQAVHQVTGLAASAFGLPDCGRVAVGVPADLTVFEPEELAGGCDFAHPHTPAQGIIRTMIGGNDVYRA